MLTSYYTPRQTFTSLLYSVPATVQQFVFSGSFRPYVLIGVSVSAVHTTDVSGKSYEIPEYGRRFGFSPVGAIGLEWNLYKGLMLTGEWRFENFKHRIMPGLAYDIPVKQGKHYATMAGIQ